MYLFTKRAKRSNDSTRTVTKRRPANGRRLRLFLEALENRTVLSTSTVTWTSATGGDWNNPANWSGDAVPYATQDAMINIAVNGPITIDSPDVAHSLTDTTASLDITGGSLSLAASSSVSQNVTISGGTLTGSGTLTVNGLLTWTGGTMSGPGTTVAAGGLQLGANDGSSYTENLAARTLQNAGSATWESTDTLNQTAGAVFENLANATLTVQNGVTWDSTNGTLDNQSKATLTVAAGTDGTATFNGFVTDEGLLEVSSGTLVLKANGSVTGSFEVDGGAALQFAGTQYVFSSGASLTGNQTGDDGTVTFGGSSATIFDVGSGYSIGTTNIESGIAAFDLSSASTHNLNQSGGTLGGSGLFTIGSGTTTWTGGVMSGSGITQCLGGTLSLGASGDTSDVETLAGRTFINDGTGVWYGPDQLTQQDGSTFLNYAGATLDVNAGAGGSGGSDNSGGDGSDTFENNGTVTVNVAGSSTTVTVVQPYFINSGTVEIASGTLHLGGGGACPYSNGAIVQAGFTVDSGATLNLGSDFSYELYTFNSGGSIGGAGSVIFGLDGEGEGGIAAVFASGSTYKPSGETLVDAGNNIGGVVAFSAGSTVGSLGNLTVKSGVLEFSTGATITVASMNLPANGSGTLSGSDTVDVTGLLTWVDGTMSGTGTTVAEGGLDLGLNDGAAHAATLAARTFNNQGAATWVGLGTIDLIAGSTFTNDAKATFDDQASNNSEIESGDGTGLLDNLGRFVVDLSSTATGTISSLFEGNPVQVNSGTWEDDSPAPPTPLDDTTEIDGGTYEETGTAALASLKMTGGYLIVTGTLTVTGAMTWSGGYIVGPGTVVVDGNLTLGSAAGSAAQVLDGTTLENQSVINVLDQDAFYQGDGAVVENNILHYIDLEGDGTWQGDGTGTILNEGTIEKTAGTGTSAIYAVELVNDGIVTVSSGGTLDLNTYGTATGAFSAAVAQSTLEFANYWWTFNSTSSVTGAGEVEFSLFYFPAMFNSNSTYNVTGQTVTANTNALDFLSGSKVQNLGSVDLESGTLDLSSSVPPAAANDSAASLTESSGAFLTGDDILTVTGPITWTGGTMSGTGSTIADGALQMGASGDMTDVEFLRVRTLDVAGGGTLEPLDTFEQSYGSNFVNTATDTLDVGGGVNWESNEGGTATINNEGALIVGVTGESVFTPPTISGGGNFPFLIDPGAIGVDVLGLNLDCDGSATLTLQASFSVLSPATLVFGGYFTLADGAGIGGAGDVEVTGGGDLWVTRAASYDITGTTIINGGTIEFDNNAVTGTLNESEGDLTGPGTLTVDGGPPLVSYWTGGTMDGPGNTVFEGSLQIGYPSDTNDQETLDGRTLTDSGTATWSGGGSFLQLDGATFVNQAGATFTIENGDTWSSNDGTGIIANAGTLEENASGDTTTIDAALDNTGSVLVEQGTLSLQGGGVVGGTYLVQAGATLTFGSDNVTTTSVAVPSDFTSGPINWNAAFSGTAQDHSGSGLASVGVSLFDGSKYYNGTGFTSPTPVYNAAKLSGSSWIYAIGTSKFQSDQAYAVATQATDNHGGTEPSTITSVLLAPPPTVSAVAPTAGPLAGGTTVTITGSALANATEVDFGTLPATIVSDTSTSIVATSPAVIAAGSVDVTVTTAAGTSVISSADQFTYVPPPAVSAIAPAAGPLAGSTTVTITGSNLANAAVYFGKTEATIDSDTGTTIMATSPSTTMAGAVDVTVMTVGGTSATSSADQFTYVAAPVVTAVAASTGPTAGGTTVTITGTGLANATAVYFGTAKAAIGTDTSTTIEVTSPSTTTAGAVDVTVMTAGGTSAKSSVDQFTYVAAPVVSAVAPSSGPTAGGTSVTINGSGLANASAVYFGTTKATIVNDTSTTIEVTSPSTSMSGAVDVTVMTAGGTSAASSADQFTYVAAPVVSAVAPSSGPTAGGTTVTITGTALANASAVYFGTAKATIGTDTNTMIVVTSPSTTKSGAVSVTVMTSGGTSATSAADQFTYGVPPTSKVAALPATTTRTSFTVSWSGSDGSGPGIASYSVYVSDNGGPYKAIVTNTTKTSAVFTGVVNNTYAFYSVATDRSGVVQPTPTAAQATTKIVLLPPVIVTKVHDNTNKQHQVTEILVTFSGPVNMAEADSTATYHLATPGTGGSYTAKNAGIIKLSSAVYKSATETVALTPVKPFTLTKPVQLIIYGTGTHGLKDTYGRYIDGADNGAAGSNAVVILSSGGAKIEALTARRDFGLAARRAAVDALFESDEL
jgi:hypothetical protein